MATKQLNSRVRLKKDTAANWTSNNPVLLDGEVAIVVTNANEIRFKIGDGTSSFTALPYQDEFIQNAINDVDDGLLAHEGDTSNPHSVTKSQVGLGNVDNVRQFSASNPPPYPVTSVNSKTGAVKLTAADVDARPDTWMPSASDVGALPISGGTLTGNLTGEYLTGTWLQSTAATDLGSSNWKGACVYDNNGRVYYRTKANIMSDLGIGDSLEKFSGTLNTSGWVSSSGQYYKQITVSGIASNSVPIVVPQWTNKSTQQAAWNTLTDVQSYNGYVRFYAPAAFTTSVNFIMYY